MLNKVELNMLKKLCIHFGSCSYDNQEATRYGELAHKLDVILAQGYKFYKLVVFDKTLNHKIFSKNDVSKSFIERFLKEYTKNQEWEIRTNSTKNNGIKTVYDNDLFTIKYEEIEVGM